jgi:hypothetical protein
LLESLNEIISSQAPQECDEGSTTRDSSLDQMKSPRAPSTFIDNNESYVYVYLDIRKPGKYSYKNLNVSFLFEPFYIGKGIRNRYLDHLGVLENFSLRKFNYKENKIRKIYQDTQRTDFVIKLTENLSDKDACELERLFIQSIGRYEFQTGPLTNLTDGGDGMLNLSPEARKRAGQAIAVAQLGNTRRSDVLKGKPASKEARELLLKYAYMGLGGAAGRNVPKSETHKRAISIATKGTPKVIRNARCKLCNSEVLFKYASVMSHFKMHNLSSYLEAKIHLSTGNDIV